MDRVASRSMPFSYRFSYKLFFRSSFFILRALKLGKYIPWFHLLRFLKISFRTRVLSPLLACVARCCVGYNRKKRKRCYWKLPELRAERTNGSNSNHSSPYNAVRRHFIIESLVYGDGSATIDFVDLLSCTGPLLYEEGELMAIELGPGDGRITCPLQRWAWAFVNVFLNEYGWWSEWSVVCSGARRWVLRSPPTDRAREWYLNTRTKAIADGDATSAQRLKKSSIAVLKKWKKTKKIKKKLLVLMKMSHLNPFRQVRDVLSCDP